MNFNTKMRLEVGAIGRHAGALCSDMHQSMALGSVRACRLLSIGVSRCIRVWYVNLYIAAQCTLPHCTCTCTTSANLYRACPFL